MTSCQDLSQDFEKELICSICKEYFTNPMSTTCGHSFCNICLIISSPETSTHFSCPECNIVSSLRDLRANMRLGKLADIAKKLKPHCLQNHEEHDKSEIQQKRHKQFSVKDQSQDCVSCPQSEEYESHTLYCKDEVAENFKRQIKESVNIMWRKAEHVVLQIANEKIKWAQDMKEVLNRNESVLQKEIETFSMKMAIHSIPGITEILLKFKVDITLNHNTASPGLIISEDLKSVKYGSTQDHVPNNHERFNDFAQVLGTQSFISRRCYWEVEVPGNTGWFVGICKGLSLNGDFFVLMTIENPNGKHLFAIGQKHRLYSKVHVKYCQMDLSQLILGFFLDYERGEISFYDVRRRYLIFSFPTSSFSEPLQPFFGLSKKVLKNDCSLTICP
ncbi:probable E3 ubiquitin-protein ligase TRIML1 [Dromiciops gliroides]|uniref:probable E3 ubiquitin-protein ligase TRIML1 n=1 Tax=Dromiciops gliroides TaxID=33562 RepID=UPI001CC683FB|nr:probable E3 ubiquitin-protein ligase TRIML1 [Dromiciops gliroides]